jgi:deoxyribodipyrimidine photo-lyase
VNPLSRKSTSLPAAGATLVWFRLDLRLADNPALLAAIDRGAPIVPVYIWSPEEEGDWPLGAASRWWLHQSLRALTQSLEARGSRLIVRRGPALATLRDLVRETGAKAIHWNRRYEPAVVARDTAIKAALRDEGSAAESFNSALLFEPWTVANRSGRPFQVFTPFWRHCLSLGDPAVPLTAPERLSAPARWPKSELLASLALEPQPDWAVGLRNAWQPGEAGAAANLRRFGEQAFNDYNDLRNRPDLPGTSRLSPHLHFGEISPRQVWHSVRAYAEARGPVNPGFSRSQFFAELGWREFAHHLLHHFPDTPREPLRAGFARFPWRTDPAALHAWQRGFTGYPIVDAGMRELWATGWMHNRVRMIVASFLVKDLLLDWREGARWFWDTLVDADLASNTLGWQWTAGCGADAAPFFRIFNPVSQGEKFDQAGDYVRRWVPELTKLPAKWIHRPWEAPAAVLGSAGISLGRSYPRPIISHAIAREVALEAFAKIRRAAATAR